MAMTAREAAWTALQRWRKNGAWSDAALNAVLQSAQLEPRDAALAARICYGTLQNLTLLDHYLSAYCTTPLQKIEPKVLDLLRLSAYQIVLLDKVPPRAAVNEAVALCRKGGCARASGLVNAVLRRACVYDLSKARFQNETERLMVLGSAGQDVAEFLRSRYPDEALGILTYAADGGRTSLRANPLKADVPTLCEKLNALGAAAQPGVVPGSVLAKFEGSPADNDLFRAGCYHVEGQASQLAALCVEAKPGETVLDLCAAPGGKTILLAEEMQGTGRLISCDAAENRVRLIRTAVERMGFANVEALCNDATRPNPKLPAADRILVDAPCSGLGILAKKPDIRYKTLPKDRHDELLATQSAILDTAASLLRAGGRLVYSTCTIDPAENENQVAAFLARHPEFSVVTPEVPLPAGMTVGEHGALSVPTRTGMDGFFLCAMQKAQ